MRRSSLLVFPLVLALTSCISPESEFASSDCTAPVQPGFTRIFIGVPARRGQQSGTSAQDPLDGTTADKFDTILRTIADGQRPTWGLQSQIPPQNLVVCIGPGIFHTNGQYDWRIASGHRLGAHSVGFTVEKNWKIHGHGTGRTMLVLEGYMRDHFTDLAGNPFAGGSNIAIGTHSPDASGVEVSDLTIDANHDALYRLESLPLNLSAIVLRSRQGGHWIHNVHVVGASGDLGAANIRYEAFPIFIWGDSPMGDSSTSRDNLVEKTSVTHPGRAVFADQFPGGSVSAIVVGNAVAEVRENLVDGYNIAYGGWSMGPAWFHDNIAKNVRYGFNADSFSNVGITLESNKFIHPALFGIMIGGESQTQMFSRWKVIHNTIEIGVAHAAGLVLRGQVQRSMFADNTIVSDRSAPQQVVAIWSYPSGSQTANFGNVFKNNQLDNSQRIDFSLDPNFDSNCRFQNHDSRNRALPGFPDNVAAFPGGCAIPDASIP
ncbi:MAG TPA: hypothetical protein VF532_14230 [Candidatus Angelobacter sp.]